MKFQIETEIPNPDFKIDYQDKLFLIGSCFSDNIGNKLSQLKFNVTQSPSGIFFNPMSIANTLNHICSNLTFNEELLIEQDGLWYSFLHHGSIYSSSKEELLSKIENTHALCHNVLKNTTKLFITFGSAHIYTHKNLKTVVSNCHKVPNTYFTKSLLTVSEIVENFKKCISAIKSINPDIKIIFTVSPVLYIKDGIHENQLSKATLLLAINELQKLENIGYFPSYEIVRDELRDYRFYKEDLAHPNDIAIKYVWEKFSDCYFSDETKEIAFEVEKIIQMENHKQLQPESDASKKFTGSLEKKKRELFDKFPFLNK